MRRSSLAGPQPAAGHGHRRLPLRPGCRCGRIASMPVPGRNGCVRLVAGLGATPKSERRKDVWDLYVCTAHGGTLDFTGGP